MVTIHHKEDYEEALSGTVDKAKGKIKEMDNPSYSRLLKMEKKGQDRETLKNWLKKQKRKDKVIIKGLEKSQLVEEDLEEMEEKSESKEKKNKKERIPEFYQKFVFRCQKCIKEFKEEAPLPSEKHSVRCPHCDEEHTLKITACSDHYQIELPETVAIKKKK